MDAKTTPRGGVAKIYGKMVDPMGYLLQRFSSLRSAWGCHPDALRPLTYPSKRNRQTASKNKTTDNPSI